jgi:enoyl-CoA hydratase/carnithine racemase
MRIPLATDNMLAEVDGAIGWMTFNQPARRNAVSLDMWQAMPVILDRFERDPEVRVIVLKGAGDQAFVSGADISQFEAERSSPATTARYEAAVDAASESLAGCAKPTVGMIRGFCIGGGLAIALGCDVRIADETARFGIPAARLGLGYGAAGVKKLMEIVGPSFTKEIFFTARHFSADEAQRMGLVNRIAADGALEVLTRQYCDMICNNAPLTLLALKKTVGELARGELADLPRHAANAAPQARCLCLSGERHVCPALRLRDFAQGVPRRGWL